MTGATHKEIERKFLVLSTFFDNPNPGRLIQEIKQGYLSTEKERTVRVRALSTIVPGETSIGVGYITVKGEVVGISRDEFEYEIPFDDATYMLRNLCLPTMISKTRHMIDYGGHEWSVDVFHGQRSGLIVAEIELQNEGENFEKPPWLGEEVTGDPKYYNSNMNDPSNGDVHPH